MRMAPSGIVGGVTSNAPYHTSMSGSVSASPSPSPSPSFFASIVQRLEASFGRTQSQSQSQSPPQSTSPSTTEEKKRTISNGGNDGLTVAGVSDDPTSRYDLLAEFERQLTILLHHSEANSISASANTPASTPALTFDKSTLTRSQSGWVKLFIHTILPQCDTYLMRRLGVQCLVKLYTISSHQVGNAYHEMLKLIESKEVNQKAMGLQW